jgi:predicted phosphoribosyltransferase
MSFRSAIPDNYRKFHNREEAGRLLAQRLLEHANHRNVIVLALPRGGVPVGFEIAKALNVPLDVFVVRKLGVPGHEELAMGAIATGGVCVLNEDVVQELVLPPAVIEHAAHREELELGRRERAYRDNRPFPELRGWIVILVDDGLATGSTMRAAAQALRRLDPARIIVAVPTAAPETCEMMRSHVDEVICAMTPDPFYAVGLWYEEFAQTTDDEVRALLERSAERQTADAGKTLSR